MQQVVLLHVHGIGPQNPADIVRHYLKPIADKVEKRSGGKAQVVIPPVIWANMFTKSKANWFTAVFPEEFKAEAKRKAGDPSAWLFSGRVRRLIAMAVVMFIALSLGVCLISLLISTELELGQRTDSTPLIQTLFYLSKVCVATIAGLWASLLLGFLPFKGEVWRGMAWLVFACCAVLAWLVWGDYRQHWMAVLFFGAIVTMLLVLLNLMFVRDRREYTMADKVLQFLGMLAMQIVRWGDAFSLTRPFEAYAASDLLIYTNREQQEQIFANVLVALRTGLDNVDVPDDQRVVVVLSGHSLGSVIVYDLLRYMNDYQTQPDGPTPIHINEALSQVMRELSSRIKVVGLYTFGSPIALFLFRRTSLLGNNEDYSLDRDSLFKELCPVEFQSLGTSTEPWWGWKNYWHPADFVSHKLAELFDSNLWHGPGKFIEDVRCRFLAPGPISAHSWYFRRHTRGATEVANHILAWCGFPAEKGAA